MAGGEYVSVSSQCDIERATSKLRAEDLAHDPQAFRQKIVEGFVLAGLSKPLAIQAVAEMDDVKLHRQSLLNVGLDSEELISPWVAARASLLSFVAGSAIPLLALVLTPASFRLVATSSAVLIALILTGYISAKLSEVSPLRPILRNAIVGGAAMGLTYLVGSGIGAVL